MKCEEWLWIDPENLTSLSFEANILTVICYPGKKFLCKELV